MSPFSEGHVRAISRIQRAILVGGYFLQIVFRGWAKSTITEVAVIWAVFYGHINFPVPIGADAKLAKAMLDSIKAECECNDLLEEDFSEICGPVRALEGKPQRCASQTCNGGPTFIEWTATHIVLPTVAGSVASGARIQPLGITASLRGLRHKRPDGTQARPDFVIVDDPQTDESARSPDQCDKRLKVLTKTILRLGGHNKRLAVVCNATVIEPDDMVDRLSNAEEFPRGKPNEYPCSNRSPTKRRTNQCGSAPTPTFATTSIKTFPGTKSEPTRKPRNTTLPTKRRWTTGPRRRGSTAMNATPKFRQYSTPTTF